MPLNYKSFNICVSLAIHDLFLYLHHLEILSGCGSLDKGVLGCLDDRFLDHH